MGTIRVPLMVPIKLMYEGVIIFSKVYLHYPFKNESNNFHAT